MLFKATTIKAFIIATCIYIAGLLTFVYVEHGLLKQAALEKIDLELRKATALTRSEISDKLHFDISGDSPIKLAKDEDLADKFTEIAKNKNLDYVYSTILHDGKIFFTMVSKTKQEISGQANYEYKFMTPYEDAAPGLFEVFNSGEESFEEYTDQKGSFRTFFEPMFNGQQISYVIGADISMEKVNSSLLNSAIITLSFGLFLGVITFPIVFLFYRSIKQEHEAEKIILFTDSVTGLNNFQKLREDINNQNNLKLVLIEIENYMTILNSIGPSKTQHILTQCINRIRLFIDDGQYDIQIYSVNPNKFGLLTSLDSSIVNTKITQDLFNRLVKNGYGFTAKNDIYLSVRMGAAANKKPLFILANMALEKAKDDNKSIVYFNQTSDLPKTYLDNLNQTSIFHQALDDGRVIAFFQPIVDANTAKIAKFECLARVVDDAGEVLQNPEDFMPIAYRSRLCHKVTRLMLDQSLKIIQNKQYSISINLSVSDLFDKATMKYICSRLDKSNHSEQIEFEILEHENIVDYNKAAKLILQLKKRGCRVGMDDLGKHYSNFDRLTNLPLDFVKIDGGIVPFILDDETALTVAKNIVHLAKNMQLDIVAEYCINEKVYDAAVSLNIDYLQGFFIGMPNPDIQELIQNHDKVKPQLIPLCPVLETTKVVKH